MTRLPGARRRVLARKIAASIAVRATAAGVESFVATGAFDNRHDPFPVSVVAHR